MLPAPPLHLVCPSCNGILWVPQTRSGNTFGSIMWTDGKRECPMLPSEPTVGACPHCRAALFLDELEEHRAAADVGDGDPFDMGTVEGAEQIREADAETFLALLARTTDPQRVLDLRIGLWWYCNDAVRPKRIETTDERSPHRPQDAVGGPIFRDNLTALLALLAERQEPEMRLFAAEARRELGDFNGAVAELAEVSDDRFAKPVERLREIAVAKKDRVEVLFPDD